MSEDRIDRLNILTQMRVAEQTITAADLTVEGELRLQVGKPDPSQKSAIQLLLEDGLQLKGISMWHGDVELVGADLAGTFLIAAGEGNGALLISESTDVLTPARRLSAVPYGSSVGVDQRQILFRYDVAASRWLIPNWPAATETFGCQPCSLIVGSESVARYYGPPATIVEVTGIVNSGIVLSASSTLTPRINATPVVNGGVTFSGSVSVGDFDTATPTADNVLATGDFIHVDQSGTNATVGTATLYLQLAVGA